MPVSEFTDCVRKALGGTATQRAAKLAIVAVTQSVAEGLMEDGEVRLANFGVFRIRERAARRLLLPGSGKPAILPERREICFTPAPSTTLPAPTLP